MLDIVRQCTNKFIMVQCVAVQSLLTAAEANTRETIRSWPSFSAQGIVRTETAADPDAPRRLFIESEFSFTVSNGWWQVEQLFSYPPELKGNGESCRRIPDGVRLNPNVKGDRKGLQAAEAYPLPFPPPDRPGNFLCWLALCPRPELPILDKDRMRRLINYDFLKDPKNEGRYEVTYLSPDAVFISKLLIQDNGLLYTSGGKLYSYVPPLEHGIVEDEYELLATTNVGAHTFPLHAIWRGFQLKSGAKSANEVYTAAETHLWVKEIALSMEHRPLVSPDQEYYALDYRFPDVKGIQRIGYVITNDNWQSVTNREMLSLAAAWGHEDKKGRSVPVIVFLGLLTAPVTLFWALARRRKNQVTRI